MQNYNFKEKRLPPEDELWLEEIFKLNSPRINKKDIKVRLRNSLPKEFNPDNIDGRYLKNDRLTLLGIWYVDHNNEIIPKVASVIKAIQTIICKDSAINLFESKTISKMVNLEEEEVKRIFHIILDFDLLSSSRTNPGELNPCEVSFSENHSGFNKVVYFSDIYETMEEYFNEKTAWDQPLSTTKNKKNIEIIDSRKLDVYVALERIEELEQLKNDSFDLSRLIQLCKELNYATEDKSYLAIAMITRTIINHIPPIFNCKNFSEVANNYNGGKSFKQLMMRLNNSLKNIADSHLHKQISEVETLPNFQQVNFSPEIDVLISEIIKIFKGKKVKLIEKNDKLKTGLVSKKNSASSRYDLKLVDGAYYFKDSIENRPNGPYCTRCYDVDSKLVILSILKPPFDEFGKFQCQNCKGIF